MGTVTLTKHNRLFWLGRYLERAYAGIIATRPLFEADTDGREGDYADYCRRVGIPNTYENTADFVRRFYFDDNDPNSIASALGYAYDNAIVLRETLSTDTLAYVQMAISAMELAAASAAPGVELQWVLDDIMAFRGSCEETIEEESSRNIIKTGASLERVDLCLRLGAPESTCAKEFGRLFNRLYKTQLAPDKEWLDFLVDALLDSSKPDASAPELVAAVESLFLDL